MAQPTTRKGTTNHQFRVRVPSDLRNKARGRVMVFSLPAVGTRKARTATIAVLDEIKVSLGTSNREEAKLRHAAASAQAHAFFASLRSEPLPLTNQQVVALSGEVYRLYTTRFLADPGSPQQWEAFKAFNRAAREGRIATAASLHPERFQIEDATQSFGEDISAGINALPASDTLEALQSRFQLLVEWVLARHQIVTDDASRIALLKAASDASTDAGWALKKAAAGDYTPDPKANRFPSIDVVKKPVSLQALYEKWQAETKPSASTLSTWNGVIKSFPEGSDVTRITAEMGLAWKETLLKRQLAAKTINMSYFAAVKTVLNYGVANRVIASNPLNGIRVNGRSRAGDSKLPYSSDEITALLKLARQEENSARRWLPLLATATGARAGELAQLWGNRVLLENDLHVIKLAPAEDGGSLKNEGSERTVPVHPALIEEGFLKFVEGQGDGPLFYKRASGRDGAKHASKGVTNRVASWIRTKDGFQDGRKAPLHAIRHWWKSAAAEIGIADSLADAIQGHSGKGAASTYRHFTLDKFFEAISKMPYPRSENS